jgi:hypothetical protein
MAPTSHLNGDAADSDGSLLPRMPVQSGPNTLCLPPAPERNTGRGAFYLQE